MQWATDTPAAGFFDPATLINFGVLGVIFIGWATGWLPSKSDVTRLEEDKRRLIAERDKADDQRDAMAATFQKELLPVLTKFLTTTEALLPLLQRVADRAGGDK